jgi:tyrosinase
MKTALLFLIAFIASSTADYFTENLLPAGCGTTQRTRVSWNSMTLEDQQLFGNVLYLMKQTQGKWKDGVNNMALYDLFVNIHAYGINSWVWHGTSFFLPAHKWFLWCFESAMIYTAYINMAQLGITQDKACGLSLPYWDWTLDYDSNTDDNYCPVTESPIFNPQVLGGNSVNSGDKTVSDGIFGTDDTTDGGWTLTQPVCSDDTNPKNKVGPNYNSKLKRRLECDGSYNLNIGPSTVMNAIVGYSRFCNWTRWLEALPHGLPHMFVGYSMATMSSPDDPFFWLHHCNIDRLWHLWMDCNGWDKITRDQLTYNQYEAWNPIAEGAGVIANPITGIPYDVGIDAPITFTRDSHGSDTLVFPGPEWPTPRKLWGMGTADAPGHDGIFYRYGQDQLVRTFSKSCPDAKSWTYVDVGYVWVRTKAKRDETLHPIMQERVDSFETKLSQGLSHKQALHEMAVQECEQAPKNELDGLWMDWIKMMNHVPENYDTICDRPSSRLQDKKNDNAVAADRLGANEMGSAVPLWLILVASISCGLVVIAIIAVIIITIRRKSDVRNTDYRQME